MSREPSLTTRREVEGLRESHPPAAIAATATRDAVHMYGASPSGGDRDRTICGHLRASVCRLRLGCVLFEAREKSLTKKAPSARPLWRSGEGGW